jgi:hypothetical protein
MLKYRVSGTRGNNAGFNTRYEHLPNVFDYRTLRERDMFVLLPVVGIAGVTLLELMLPRNDPFPMLGFMLVYGFLTSAIGYGLRCLLRREYTVLTTLSGNLTIVKDRQHDRIL